jgi:phosphoribosylglycinamide formyltransferase-1
MTERTGPLRVAVLASGGGSNLQAILDHFGARGDTRTVDVALVASNRAGAGALDRARAAGVPAAVIADAGDGAALARLLESHRVECIALAGYLKLVPPEVTARWRGRIVNIHPALLPKFGGAGMYGRRVHEAVLASGDRESGATVHQVDDAYDRGAIISQERVPVEAGDTAESLGARVLAAEHRLYPRTLEALARQLITSR